MTPEEFIKTYIPQEEGLHRVAYRLLGSWEEAEDVVQDLYIKLWGQLDELDNVKSPQAWCLILLRNLCVDHIRKRGGQQIVALTESLPEAEARERGERLDRVLELIRSLPPKSQELLRLRMVENLSYEEISQRTGQNKIGLRVAFHRLKNQLKKKI